MRREDGRADVLVGMRITVYEVDRRLADRNIGRHGDYNV